MTTGFCVQGFLTITGQIITIVGSEGWRGVTIACDSKSSNDITISSTLNGNATIGGQPLGSMVLHAGESITVGVSTDADVDGVIIDASAGGTAKIAASRYATGVITI